MNTCQMSKSATEIEIPIFEIYPGSLLACLCVILEKTVVSLTKLKLSVMFFVTVVNLLYHLNNNFNRLLAANDSPL